MIFLLCVNDLAATKEQLYFGHREHQRSFRGFQSLVNIRKSGYLEEKYAYGS